MKKRCEYPHAKQERKISFAKAVAPVSVQNSKTFKTERTASSVYYAR